MAKRTEKTSILDIAVEGDGISPRNVSLRQLADLLVAMAATVESVAADQNLEAPAVSLAGVTTGSARYELLSETKTASRVFRSIRKTVRERGRGSSRRTRSALIRLHRVVTKTGHLRIEPDTPKGKPIRMAAPVEEDEMLITEGTVVYGRVVGLHIDAQDRAAVAIRYDDGDQAKFSASNELLDQAASLIRRHVRARVTFERGNERDYEGEIESIEANDSEDGFLAAMDELREKLTARGIEIDAATWLAEEDEP